MRNGHLFFDATLLQGSKEEVDVKKQALIRAGCLLFQRSITTVLTSYLDAPCELKARDDDAPSVFSNASFVWWCLGKIGVHVGRKPVTQRRGRRPIVWGEFHAGDIVCFALPENRRPLHGVITESNKLIYACPFKGKVVEEQLEDLATSAFYGIRKLLPIGQQRVTTVIRLPAGVGLRPTHDTIEWLLNSEPILQQSAE